MSRFLEEAKRFVMQSFSSRSEVGEPFDMRYFFQRSHTLSPPAKDEIEKALSELGRDGILDEESRITALGIDTYYPIDKADIRRLLLSFMQGNRMKKDDAVDFRLVIHQIVLSNGFGSRQKKVLFDEVFPSLVSEGLLDNLGEGAYFLTQKGYESLY